MTTHGLRRWLILPALMAAGIVVAGPAIAQSSPSYRFLQAVRKKDVPAVFAALDDRSGNLVNTRDVTTGDSALHIVVRNRELPWVRFLRDRGANVNLHNNKGETPLMLASGIGFVEAVELLVSMGARVDEANATGETPLITAAHRRDAAMTRVLLKAGADPRRNDNSGRSALDYARIDGESNPVLEVLEAAGKPRGGDSSRPAYGPSL